MKPLKPKDEKNIISSEYFQNERPSYICSICNQGPLSRLSDAGGNNQTYWCKNCSVSYDPTEENVRKESKLSVPLETEPAVASIVHDYNKDVEVRHPKELRGGIAELQKRGLKITYFDDSSQR